MKICPSCKVTFPDSKKYCNRCGEALVRADEGPPGKSATETPSQIEGPTAQPDEVSCPSCRRPLLNPHAKFCQFCGSPLGTAQLIKPTARPTFPVAPAPWTQKIKSILANFSSRELQFGVYGAIGVGILMIIFLIYIGSETEVTDTPLSTPPIDKAVPSSDSQASQTTEPSAGDLVAEERVSVLKTEPKLPAPGETLRRTLRISMLALESKLRHRIEPVYPDSARVASLEGEVLLEVTVDERGTVSRADLVRGDPALGQAALEAVRLWKYSPTTVNGEPATVVSNVAITFSLPKHEPAAQAAVRQDALEEAPQAEPAPASAEQPSEPSLFRKGEDRKAPQSIPPDLVRAALNLDNEMFEVVLLQLLSASGNKKSDPFIAKVLKPETFRDAIVEGEVVKAKASGKVRGKSELLLRFDRLLLTDGTSVPIQADLVGTRNAQGQPDLDEEGRMVGRSSKKEDLARTALTSGVGALIGGVLGGKEGAAKGAAIGAVVGLTITFTTRGEDIRFAPGSVFLISVTAQPTQ